MPVVPELPYAVSWAASVGEAGAQEELLIVLGGVNCQPPVPPPSNPRLLVEAPLFVMSGVAFTYTVTALDEQGGVDTGFGGNVSFTSTDPNAILPDAYRFGKAEGGTQTFTATLFSAGMIELCAQETKGRDPLSGCTQIEVLAAPEIVTIPNADKFWDIDIVNPSFGWVVGKWVGGVTPLVLFFDGDDWIPQDVGGFPGCSGVEGAAVSFSGSDNGWMSVLRLGCSDPQAQGLMYRFSGTKWEESVEIPGGNRIYPAYEALELPVADDGWMSITSWEDPTCESRVTLQYRLSGTTWELFQKTDCGAADVGRFMGISFADGDPSVGWAVDGHSSPFRFQRSQWEWLTQYDLSALSSVFINGSDDVWAGSFGGVMYHFDGQTWSQYPNPLQGTSANFAGISFVDGDRGVAVGKQAGYQVPQLPVVLVFSNGTWHDLPVRIPAGFDRMWFTEVSMVGAQEAWAIGRARSTTTYQEMPVLVRLHLPMSVSAVTLASNLPR